MEKKDAILTKRVLNNETFENHEEVFASSNENLVELFKNFSVRDKKVLSVLASSDYLFHSYYNGAARVDTFDVNMLTKYYYYLRKWVIEYLGIYYPERLTSRYIRDLLFLVEPKSEDEKKAYNYWNILVNSIPKLKISNLFLNSVFDDGNAIKDIDRLRSLLRGRKFNFRCMDITSDELDINGTYDVILTSNIPEYFCGNVLKINRYKSNLLRLLRPGGIVVSTHFIYSTVSDEEKELLEDDFERQEFPYYRISAISSPLALGYSSTKKR